MARCIASTRIGARWVCARWPISRRRSISPTRTCQPGIADQVRAGITQLQAEIAAHLDDRRGERLREGLSIAIIGPPNAGKSSLLNLLARREAAIVSEIAGTTRDVIEVHIDLGGWPVVLADTAGLRLSGDAIEQEGVRRARARAASADLRVLVLDAVGEWKSEMQALTEAIDRWNPAIDIVVVNKVDLAPVKAPGVVPISAMSERGPARTAEAAGALGRDADAERRGRRARRSPARAIARRWSKCQASLGRALRGAGDRAGGGGPSAGAAGARPHHRHGADRRAAGRDLPRLLHREVTQTGVSWSADLQVRS